MKTGFLPVALLSALLLAAGTTVSAADKADAATLITMKRVSERYALTKARIATLLDQRLHPVPLPANLPSPFYHPPATPADGTVPGVIGPPAETAAVPAEADITDADTLKKFVDALKIGGLTILNGRQLLTLNQTLCKEGDIIPVDRKGRTLYIKVVKITPDELTLGLNDDQQVVHIKH